jgi:hypothetical protein
VRLKEAVAEAVAEELTGGVVFVLNRRDLARRSALEAPARGRARGKCNRRDR